MNIKEWLRKDRFQGYLLNVNGNIDIKDHLWNV